ncbi:hypothetical protein, partial [Azospirillum brasilense]|uniref:hypothetical protein n=1 Tax=Azospirillum brasilense TaxID=192 RepID=UPI00157AA3F7
AVIAGVVLINAAIGYVQEGKAEQALDAIRNMLSPQAVVVRGGHRGPGPAAALGCALGAAAGGAMGRPPDQPME